MLKQALFYIAKAPFMGKVIGIAFRYFSWVIPVKKIYNSKDIVAFYHPKPSYENHIVLVPKRAVANLQQLASDKFQEYFAKIWEATGQIQKVHPEYQDSFVLIANAGKRQEVSEVHFHMFTNHDVVNAEWELHRVFPVGASGHITAEYFKDILRQINLLEEEFNIMKNGYSLVYQFEKQAGNNDTLMFHIVAGKKLSC